MKFLTPLLIIFSAFTVQAQDCERFADYARRAECYAHYGRPNYPNYPTYPTYPGHGNGSVQQPPVYDNGHLVPGPQYPGNGYAPDYGYGLRGPQRTIRWADLGTNRVPKFVSEVQTIHVGGQLVNELLIRAIDNRVQIESVMAVLNNGQRIDLRFATGSIREGNELRTLVDRYYSLRIHRLEIRASSPNLIGSRGKFQTLVGFAE